MYVLSLYLVDSINPFKVIGTTSLLISSSQLSLSVHRCVNYVQYLLAGLVARCKLGWFTAVTSVLPVSHFSNRRKCETYYIRIFMAMNPQVMHNLLFRHKVKHRPSACPLPPANPSLVLMSLIC